MLFQFYTTIVSICFVETDVSTAKQLQHNNSIVGFTYPTTEHQDKV